MKTTTIEIITPERIFLKQENAEFVVIPGYSGELGILSGHMEVLALLVPGEVRVTVDGNISKYMIAAGFAQVDTNGVKVFTTMARAKS